jgi:osmoprotectant transport system permease protein
MYRAIASDDVQVISAFSSDGRIAANDLLVLDDPLAAVLPYDAVLLLSPMRASDPVLLRALTPLIEAVPIELMRRASLMVDGPRAKVAPREAAVWLASQISTTSKASAAHQH